VGVEANTDKNGLGLLIMRRGADRDITTAAFVLGVVEALLIAAAVCVSTVYMTGRQTSFAAGGLTFSISIVAIILIIMHLTGLYGVGMLVNLRVALSRIALVTAMVFGLAVVTTGQLAKYDIVTIYPYRWQWTFALTAIWLLCVLGPRVFLNMLIERGYFARRIIAATDEKDSVGLNELTRLFPGRFVVSEHLVPADVMSGAKLSALSARHGAPEIVVSKHDRADRDLTVVENSKSWSSVRVTDYSAFYERETGRVDLDDLNSDWLAQTARSRTGIFAKTFRRCFDILVALIAFAASAPVMALVALAIRLEDGEPILFRQTRVGLNGREFTLFKFRSMRVDAEQDGAPLWAADNDPRITRVGSFIRKLRIDELPQFYNVLRGDMSFIGPRPERPYFVQQLAELIPFYNDRHCVKPGITGWAQVSFHYGASFEDARHKTAYDLYYVKNRGLLLDMIIIARTVKVVLWPQGVR
jgi:sugar transferase (PEP-CTERM system associated)